MLAIAPFVSPGRRSLAISALYGLLLAMVLGDFLRRAHWQLVPLYLIALLVPWIVRNASRTRWIVAGVLTLLLTASFMALSFLLPMFRLPEPTGPYPVGTRILHMLDLNRPDSGGRLASGRRELMVQAWYPIDKDKACDHRAPYRKRAETTMLSSYMAVLKTQSCSDTPISKNEESYPVILFNPAWKGQRTQSTYLMQELASHGFVVISIDHTYLSGPVAFPDGTVIRSADVQDIDDFQGRSLAAVEQQGEDEVTLEAADDSFVLDELTTRKATGVDPWYQSLRLNRVGAAGHSFGGAVAYQVASSDRRIASALNMDGWTFGDPLRRGFRTPTMQMYEDVARPSDAELQTAAEDKKLYWNFDRIQEKNVTCSLQRIGGYQLMLKGGRHMNFADRSLYSPMRKWTDSGVTDPRQLHQIISAYTLAFFEETLLDKREPLLMQSSSPFPKAVFTRYAPFDSTIANASKCTDKASQISQIHP
jgi:predicted dienelactone hydrolase